MRWQRANTAVDNLYECLGDSNQSSSFNCDEQHYNIYAAGRLVAVVSRDSFGVDTTKYVHSDHLGSAIVITDSAGKLLEQRKYDAFGNPSADLSTSELKIGYTGQEHDAELGLINMKGRIYDPLTRRFLTADPWVTNPFHPQGLNRFTYVQNNPLNFVDPTGFMQEWPGGGGPGEGAGGGGAIYIQTPLIITGPQSLGYVNTNANPNMSDHTMSGFDMGSRTLGNRTRGRSGEARRSEGG